MRVKIIKAIEHDDFGGLPSGMVGKEFDVVGQDEDGIWVMFCGSETQVIKGEYEVVEAVTGDYITESGGKYFMYIDGKFEGQLAITSFDPNDEFIYNMNLYEVDYMKESTFYLSQRNFHTITRLELVDGE